MIDQNTKNIGQLIKQALARIGRTMSLSGVQRLELALAFTFLRRIDCLTGKYAKKSYSFYSKNKEKLSDEQLEKALKEISGGYSFYNVSGYTLKSLLSSDLSVEVAFNSYMQGFNSDVQYLFSDLNFEKNVAILQRKSKYLVDLFEFFSELNLSESAFSNKQFIDIITTMVSNFSMSGEVVTTPIGLSKLVCECLFCDDACKGLSYDEPSDYISIYDPVCGTGSLLAYAGERAQLLTGSRESVYMIGKDISSISCAIAAFLVLFTGNEDSFVSNVNTLTEDDPDDFEYKFVIGDLPLGLSWAPIKGRIENESAKETGRFSKGLPSTNDSQFLFIQDIVSKMDSMGGRAAFITSDYVLQDGSVKSGESRIRTWLFESGLVETIVALPSGILSPYTKTPVFLWILTCNETPSCNDFCEKLDGKVRLIDTTRLIPSGEKFKFDDSFIDSVVREYKSLDDTDATRIVDKEEFGFYELNLLEQYKDVEYIETIRISLDTDVNTFVEKERKPYIKGRISIDYSSTEKGYAVDFRDFYQLEETPIASYAEESHQILTLCDSIESLRKDINNLMSINVDASISEFATDVTLRTAVEIIRTNSKTHIIDMEGLPIITVASLRGETSESERYAVTHKSRCVSSQDVILVRTGANAGEVFKGEEGILSPNLVAVRCINNYPILPEYLYYLLKGYEKSLRQLTNGATIKSLNTRALLDYKCLVPSLEEQKVIVTQLDNIVGKLDTIINELGNSNSIFTQYRQTLIENAVRGKIKFI